MDPTRLWDVFSTTGDPVCWLIFRASLDAGEKHLR